MARPARCRRQGTDSTLDGGPSGRLAIVRLPCGATPSSTATRPPDRRSRFRPTDCRIVKKVDAVLLTHHHRDTCRGRQFLLADEGAGPPPEGVGGVADGRGRPQSTGRSRCRCATRAPPTWSCPRASTASTARWTTARRSTGTAGRSQVVATPGHSRDHVAFAARKGKDGPLLVFCGDALAAPGKLWSPYTTDWDHWTDAGLKPAAESLRKLADAEARRAAARPTAPVIAQGRRRRPGADRGRRRGGRLPQELRALHQAAPRQRRRSTPSWPRSRPSRTARKPWSQVSRAPLADRQHLRADLEGRRLPGRRPVGPAQRRPDRRSCRRTRSSARSRSCCSATPTTTTTTASTTCPDRDKLPGLDARPGRRAARRAVPAAGAVPRRPAGEVRPPPQGRRDG